MTSWPVLRSNSGTVSVTRFGLATRGRFAACLGLGVGLGLGLGVPLSVASPSEPMLARSVSNWSAWLGLGLGLGIGLGLGLGLG